MRSVAFKRQGLLNPVNNNLFNTFLAPRLHAHKHVRIAIRRVNSNERASADVRNLMQFPAEEQISSFPMGRFW